MCNVSREHCGIENCDHHFHNHFIRMKHKNYYCVAKLIVHVERHNNLRESAAAKMSAL